MDRSHVIHIQPRLSNLAVDEIHYELVHNDWRRQAERLQERRWHLLQQVASARHARHTYERSLL